MTKGKGKSEPRGDKARVPGKTTGSPSANGGEDTDGKWPSDVQWISDNVWDARVPEELFRKYQKKGPRIPVSSPAKNKNVKFKRIDSTSHPACGQFGLFAAKKLVAKSHVLDYVGYVTLCRDESKTSDYTLALGDELAVDAAAMGNEARMINDYRGTGVSRANAQFSERVDDQGTTRMAVFVADRDIPKGTEIVVSYGKGYWEQRGLLACQEW